MNAAKLPCIPHLGKTLVCLLLVCTSHLGKTLVCLLGLPACLYPPLG